MHPVEVSNWKWTVSLTNETYKLMFRNEHFISYGTNKFRALLEHTGSRYIGIWAE